MGGIPFTDKIRKELFEGLPKWTTLKWTHLCYEHFCAVLITYIMYKFDQAIYYDIGGSDARCLWKSSLFQTKFFILKLKLRDFWELYFSFSDNTSFPQRMMSPSPKRAGRASEQISTVLSKYLMRWVQSGRAWIPKLEKSCEHFQTIFNIFKRYLTFSNDI